MIPNCLKNSISQHESLLQWPCFEQQLIDAHPELLQDIQQLSEEHDLDWVRDTLPEASFSCRMAFFLPSVMET